MKATFNIWFFSFVLLGYRPASAQFYNMPGDYFFSLLSERTLAKKDTAIHTGIKPYIPFFSEHYQHTADTHKLFKYITEDPALETIFFKHLIRLEPKAEHFKLRFDPILNLESGKDFSDSLGRRPYTNTRGIIASGSVGKTFYFETMFSENQSVFPSYISNAVKSSSIVPGQGRWKTFKTQGYDYAFASGFFSVQPLKNLNIQFGHGKQKIGHGYRSLLLSDNAFNYPYARITQQLFKGRVQYSTIYAVLMNLTKASILGNANVERLFQKKAAAFQYLSINPNKSLNIAFFQGLIWEAGDNHNKQNITWQYFNPLIFANLSVYGLNHKNNMLVGMDVKYKVTKSFNVYAQTMLDGNEYISGSAAKGCQLGLNYFDAFGIQRLFLQAEYNYVESKSYLAPGSFSTQAYTHYNQNLAYTPGSGQEFVVISDYRYKRVFANIKYNYQQNPVGLMPIRFTTTINAKVGYLINPSYNLNICLGVTYRNQNFYNFKSLNNETTYIYLGIKTSIYNMYYDF